MTVEQQLQEAVKKAAGKVPAGFSVEISMPDRAEMGDYATSIAMKLAPTLKQPPIEIAKVIAERLQKDKTLAEIVDRVESVPPGFVNIFLRDEWLAAKAGKIVQEGERYGTAEPQKKQKVQVEFISANPTGPLTLANGRGGFIGDAIARVLIAAGHDVTREYYVNDGGEQVKKLGSAVLAQWGVPVPYPEDELYKGAYVEDLAEQLAKDYKPSGTLTEDERLQLLETVTREATNAMLGEIKRVVTKKARIPMDEWYSEKSLERRGLIIETIKELQRKNLVQEKDGALWLKLSALSEGTDDSDKVVVKSNGQPAYILPDIAYHRDKFGARRFTRVIDLFGADHQSTAKILPPALQALGSPAPEILLMQMVRLISDGKEVKMSKRAGTFVTLEELLDELGESGSDVARWFFIERTPNTHMNFDLALAKDTSDKNPVFYVQYAHARCCAILRKAQQHTNGHENENEMTRKTRKGGGGLSVKSTRSKSDSAVRVTHPSERGLVRELVKLPDFVLRISESLEVHHLTTYATDVAKAFSAFYRDCPVLSGDEEQMTSRLALVQATQTVLANTLGLMGIRAPETM